MLLAAVDGMAFSGRWPDSPSSDEMAEEVISIVLDGLRTPGAAAEPSDADMAAAGARLAYGKQPVYKHIDRSAEA